MTEMEQLHTLLDGCGIGHEFNSMVMPDDVKMDLGSQILVPDLKSFQHGKGYSVVCHPFSYGGDSGLLEAWRMGQDPQGWLSAEEALKVIREGLGI